jgi:hypothetical protein
MIILFGSGEVTLRGLVGPFQRYQTRKLGLALRRIVVRGNPG